jgi:hypothetical protein
MVGRTGRSVRYARLGPVSDAISVSLAVIGTPDPES